MCQQCGFAEGAAEMNGSVPTFPFGAWQERVLEYVIHHGDPRQTSPKDEHQQRLRPLHS